MPPKRKLKTEGDLQPNKRQESSDLASYIREKIEGKETAQENEEFIMECKKRLGMDRARLDSDVLAYVRDSHAFMKWQFGALKTLVSVESAADGHKSESMTPPVTYSDLKIRANKILEDQKSITKAELAFDMAKVDVAIAYAEERAKHKQELEKRNGEGNGS